MSQPTAAGDAAPATMRAVVVTRPGGLEALEIKDVPVPVRKPGWVRIKVKAFGVNDVDRCGDLRANGRARYEGSRPIMPEPPVYAACPPSSRRPPISSPALSASCEGAAVMRQAPAAG